MSLPQLQFDAEKHEYSCDGRRVHGVTETISIVVPRSFDVDDWYLQRGKVCHQFFELLGTGGVLKMNPCRVVKNGMAYPVPEEIIPRVVACDKFLRESGVKILATEIMVHHRTLNYAGTMDADAKLPNGESVLIDWKNSVSAHVIPQIGLYSLARPIYNRAVAVELKVDGNYKCLWFSRTPRKHHAQVNLSDAENIAKAVLTVAGFFRAEKINQQKEKQ